MRLISITVVPDSVTVLLTVSLPMALLPGRSVPLTPTAPLMKPVPPSVPLPATVTAPLPERPPFTSSVPYETVVEPV